MLNSRLNQLLTQKKPFILERWLQLIYDSYPPETAIFLRKEKDRFDNPVGHRLTQGTRGLYETLLKEMEDAEIDACLDEILRIRAIQDFPPSRALAILFLLKGVIREELAPELAEENLNAGMLDLEARIDGLALRGFDVYTKCREQLHEIRVTEVKNRISGLLRKTGMNISNI